MGAVGSEGWCCRAREGCRRDELGGVERRAAAATPADYKGVHMSQTSTSTTWLVSLDLHPGGLRLPTETNDRHITADSKPIRRTFYSRMDRL